MFGGGDSLCHPVKACQRLQSPIWHRRLRQDWASADEPARAELDVHQGHDDDTESHVAASEFPSSIREVDLQSVDGDWCALWKDDIPIRESGPRSRGRTSSESLAMLASPMSSSLRRMSRASQVHSLPPSRKIHHSPKCKANNRILTAARLATSANQCGTSCVCFDERYLQQRVSDTAGHYEVLSSTCAVEHTAKCTWRHSRPAA